MKKSLTLVLALVALAVFSGLGFAQHKGDEKKPAVGTAKSKSDAEVTPATGDNASTSESSLTVAPQDANAWTKAGSTVRLSTSTDNVGIGTTKPTAKLDVAGVIHASDAVTVGNSVGVLSSGILNLIEVDNANPLAIGFSNPMTATPNPVPLASIKVGIGVTNPTNTLDVNGQARIRVLPNNLSLNDVVVADPSGVLFRRSAISLATGTSWLLTGNTLTGTEFLGSINSFPLRFFTNGGEKMRIEPGGNVGIATTSPTQKLTLGSGNVLLANANAGTDGNLYFGGITDNSQTGMRMFDLVNSTFASGFIDVRVNPTNLSDGLIFRVDSNNGGTERMRITASGNVGIGTAAPAALLSVGNNNPFQVNSSGDLIKIKNVTYSWPASNAAGVLTNNGTGGLSWTPASGGGLFCGSGQNFVTKWSSTSAVTCSKIFEDNQARVGIGTITPVTRLHVTENIVTPSLAAVQVDFTNSTSASSALGVDINSPIALSKRDNIGARARTSINVPGGFAGAAEGRLSEVVSFNAFGRMVGVTGISTPSILSASAPSAPSFAVGGLFQNLPTSPPTYYSLGTVWVGGVYGEIANTFNANPPTGAIAAVIGVDNSNGTANHLAGYFSGKVQVTSLAAGPNAGLCISPAGVLSSCTSDLRLKTNVRQLSNVLAKVDKIRGVSFNWSEVSKDLVGSTAQRNIGVIAQEVETVFPEAVTNSGNGYKAVNYNALTAVLFQAVKELKAENDALKQRLEALENAVTKR